MASSSASGSKAIRAAALLAALALMPGCDVDEAKRRGVGALRALLAEPAKAPSPKPSPSPGPDLELSSEAARSAKANAELLREIFTVVFGREPRDRANFGVWVDAMNQGASIEGIYNGFTHSSDYRQVEENNPGASPDALKVFGVELARLQSELPSVTEFDTSAAQPLPRAKNPEAEAGNSLEFKKRDASPLPARAKTEQAALAESYSKTFVGASIFTLKRVLGDEALKVIASKKDYPENLAIWYSKWVVQLASYRVDFGLPLRNSADEKFHFKWTLDASEDRLKWEVLNRLHRLLNEANRQKQ